ncbi:MAG: 1,4-alpha-glucan branching enzyme, partial [Deltaproteobacteria bacterium]|nr:1,4-alpha-glucan branching enzyme [Deltaproteobacteria bacterium]
MYRKFGAYDKSGCIEFKLFFPGASAYKRGGDPKIVALRVVGDFHQPLNGVQWDVSRALTLTPQAYNGGTLYSCKTDPLPDGFYQYKYLVTFVNGETRIVGDPCARYGGSDEFENAGVVVGGSTPQQNLVPPLTKRLPLQDLIIYELHIGDFTSEYRANRTPMDALIDRLDYIASLGFNAVETLPWTAWPSGDFSWGYNPFMYFSVENYYVDNPAMPAEKLSKLKRFVKECHARGLHVIMDGVFNHVEKRMFNRGFAYYWLYQELKDCPFIGDYGEGGFFENLDFGNECTQQFVLEVCKYWIEVVGIDGIRFDFTKGFYVPGDSSHGLPKLIADLRDYLGNTGQRNFSLIIEHLAGYAAIDVANQVDATSCWYDEFYWRSREWLKYGYLDGRIMRLLHSARDFGAGRVPTTYIENHDHAQVASNAGGRARWYRTQPHAIALYTVCGAPLVFSGQEFGEDYWMPEGYEETETLQRVVPRPKRWTTLGADSTAGFMRWLYGTLAAIRKAHPALRSPNFYPSVWFDSWDR